MKTTHYPALAIAAITGSLLLAACSNSPAEQSADMEKKMDKIEDKMADSKVADSPAEWENEREAILKDLRDLRDNIDRKLARTTEKLASKDLKPSERTEQEAMRVELNREKDKVAAAITKAENATDANWNASKAELRQAADEVQGWWARQMEKIDVETKADNDKDGH